MKLTRCRNCKKFTLKDIWNQNETWKCRWCPQEVCVHCYMTHTVIHYPEIYPDEGKNDANQGQNDGLQDT